ncbi:MAG: cyanophycinase, partial [Planctomycetaceae bacterium]|nr:cyanophycinase [Planctomycetaceae bacterium]
MCFGRRFPGTAPMTLPAWCCLLSSCFFAWTSPVSGQDQPRVDPAGISGALVIVGGGSFPRAAKERFLKLAGGDSSKLVIIPTASDDAGLPPPAATINSWCESGAIDVAVLHTRSREQANDRAFLAPLNEATGVWFDGGSQSRIAEAYVGTEFEKQLASVLARGGVVGGSSAGAAVMSKVMIAQGLPIAEIKTGFDLLPGSIIDQHFTERKRKPRLLGAIAQHRELFGLGIDESTAVIVQGRNLEVVGQHNVTLCLPKSATQPAREIVLTPGDKSDLTRWRRAVVARTLPEFPPQQPAEPRVEKGSLMIVGGGGMTPEMVQRFIELAGGPDSPIVVLPTANPEPLRNPPPDGRFLERAG